MKLKLSILLVELSLTSGQGSVDQDGTSYFATQTAGSQTSLPQQVNWDRFQNNGNANSNFLNVSLVPLTQYDGTMPTFSPLNTNQQLDAIKPVFTQLPQAAINQLHTALQGNTTNNVTAQYEVEVEEDFMSNLEEILGQEVVDSETVDGDTTELAFMDVSNQPLGTEPEKNLSSFHIGFVDDPSKLNRDDLSDEIEERLKRAEDSEVPSYSGYLPVEYFDEDDERLEADEHPWVSNAPTYVPYQISDEELLNRPAITVSPYRATPEETNVYCYPFGEEDINTRCLEALEYFKATGVYLPMMAEIGAEKPKTYYEEIRKLRSHLREDGTRYKIYGVSYDNPNWSLIVQVLLHHPLFDGIMLEWIGQNACVWNIHPPTQGQIQTIKDRTNDGDILYFYRQQTCDQDIWSNMLEESGGPGGLAFINPNSFIDPANVEIVSGKFPAFLKPVFPCFQGEEGPCYQAFRNYPDQACSAQQVKARSTAIYSSYSQKFAFSPYEPLGNLMMYFANETCHGMPSHDLYSVV